MKVYYMAYDNSTRHFPAKLSFCQTKFGQTNLLPYTGSIWWEKYLANHTGKAIGEEKISELATVSAYAKYIFVYLWILARK